jgi:hypothetical protein
MYNVSLWSHDGMHSHRLNSRTNETTFTFHNVSSGYYLVEVLALNNEGLRSLLSADDAITLESEKGM